MPACPCCGGKYDGRRRAEDRCAECLPVWYHNGNCGRCGVHCDCPAAKPDTDPDAQEYAVWLAERRTKGEH